MLAAGQPGRNGGSSRMTSHLQVIPDLVDVPRSGHDRASEWGSALSRSRAAPSLTPAAGSTLILRREALCDKRLGPRSIVDARELGAEKRAVHCGSRGAAADPRHSASD